jgi:uncharacterized membrane protein YccC
MDTFIKLGSVVAGIVGLVFLFLLPPVGVVFIVLGLLIFVAHSNARKREEERRWREEMLKK